MHTSAFNYNVTRPYPYPWFSWVVIVGGICATVAVTIFNIAVNGYELQVQLLYDIASLNDQAWFERKPWSWASKVLPNCQPQPISQGSQLFTGNRVLQYTMDTFISNADADNPYYLPYLGYQLRNCTWVSLEMEWPKNNASFDGTTYRTLCSVYNGSAYWDIRLSTTLDDDIVLNILGNSLTQANARLGFGIASWYLTNYSTLSVHNEWNIKASFAAPGIPKDEDTWTPDETRFIAELDFTASNETAMHVELVAPTLEQWNAVSGNDILAQKWMNITSNQGSLNVNESDQLAIATLWVNGYAKALMSAIMSDLGQSAATNNVNSTNVFASPQNTMDFTNKSLQLANPEDWETLRDWFDLTDFYNASENPLGSVTAFNDWAQNGGLPTVQPATFLLQYLCQIPKLKPAGSLFISILVTDLVVLQAIWAAFTWVVTYFTERKREDARYCTGCAKAVALGQLHLDEEPVPNRERKLRSTSSTYSTATTLPLLPLDVSIDESKIGDI